MGARCRVCQGLFVCVRVTIGCYPNFVMVCFLFPCENLHYAQIEISYFAFSKNISLVAERRMPLLYEVYRHLSIIVW
jgi:hypothetical protein